MGGKTEGGLSVFEDVRFKMLSLLQYGHLDLLYGSNDRMTFEEQLSEVSGGEEDKLLSEKRQNYELGWEG